MEVIPLMDRRYWSHGHLHAGSLLLGYNLKRWFAGVAFEHSRRAWFKVIVYVGPLWGSCTWTAKEMRR